MSSHRYWRATGFGVAGTNGMDLTSAILFLDGNLSTPGSATVTASLPPATGAVSSLADGDVTNVVHWDRHTITQPGFALNWDFGGSPVANCGLQLGSGASSLTFPTELRLQYSDDGMYWTDSQVYLTVLYPGAFTLSSFQSAVSDPYASNLVLYTTTSTGSIVDASPSAHTISFVGSPPVSIDTDTHASMLFTGANCLTIPSTLIAAAGEDFTIEAWVKPAVLGSYNQIANGAGSCQFLLNGGRFWLWTIANSPASVVAGVEIHVAACRVANVLTLYANGVGGTPVSHSAALSIETIGSYGSGAGEFFSGDMRFLRATKGAARYTANFTPTDSFAGNPTAMATDLAFKFLSKGIFSGGGSNMPGSTFEAMATKSRQLNFGMTATGGLGVVSGTVAEKHTPTNTPLRRKVVALDEASMQQAGVTWSDATTGAYSFNYLDTAHTYTIIAYDYTGVYRAVIADHQVPV